MPCGPSSAVRVAAKLTIGRASPYLSSRRHGACHLLRTTLLLASAVCLVESQEPNRQNRHSNSQSQDEELESVSDLAPSAIHWALAVILGVALIGGLIRVAHVLQKEDGIAPMRHAPEGMRPVQCGACQAMQHVTMHGRIFICFSCHSANRIAMDPISSDEPLLVAATGPLRCFEFKREGENFFQETKRVEIEDAEAAQLIASSATVLPEATAQTSLLADSANGAVVEGNEMATAGDLEAGESNAPRVLGNQCQDAELISNNPSVCSRKSKMSGDGTLPTCVVCLEDPGNMVLLPCAHGGVCDGCITRIAQNRASGGAHCPHCRSVIETLVRIHKVDGNNIKGVEFRIPIARAL